MSQRESPVWMILILGVIFTLITAGIWSAYKVGFGANLNTENAFRSQEANIEVAKQTLYDTPTSSANSQTLRTANDIAISQIQLKITFLPESAKVTDESQEKLNKMAEEIAKFDPQRVGVQVITYSNTSESGEKFAQQRGEEVAGDLRAANLQHTIVLSTKDTDNTQINLNESVEVRLFKIK